MSEDEPTTSHNPDSQDTESLAEAGPVATRIGPYKILQTLGEGGMGIVYLAEQEAPLRRRVALKIIKPGMDSKQVLARFESERQALAILGHPNLTKVFDAGTTEQGHPYFVMEYVAGVSITEYCDRHLLSSRERLELFLPVCEAIQHAHGKGIIHRDIKASNVLVAIEDGRAVPKVIDFGVAKATSQRLTERTLFTEQGVLIGTPEYMSPEQAEMTALDVDSRTDVYSLGVLLYELLVGALPFDTRVMRRAGYAEMQRIIREEVPPTPSARLKSLGERATDVARRRRVDIRSLRNELRGDLDRISSKALEKDRTRRYATAADLGADVRRHLRGEPVLAGRPSRFGLLRRGLGASPPLIGVVGLGVAAIVWIVGASVEINLPARRDLEKVYYDFLLARVRGPLPPPAEVVIVALDEESERALDIDRRWPLPRRLHADLILALKREGARAIAFDILFVDPGDPAQDDALASAIAEAGNVILGSSIELVEGQRFREERRVEPYGPFAEAAAAVAEVNLPIDSDGVIRYVWLMSGERPTLALAAYEVATGDRSLRGETARLIDYAGPARTVRTVSLVQALDPPRQLPLGFFRGKIVFVGVSRAGPTGLDAYQTPFQGASGASTPGVEVHATILGSLLRGSLIRICGAVEEWLILGGAAVLGLGVGFAGLSTRRKTLAFLGLPLAYGAVVSVAFVRFTTWLPMIGPLAMMLVAFALGSWTRRRWVRGDR